MAIFTRIFDFLTWLLPATNNFLLLRRNIHVVKPSLAQAWPATT